MKTLLNLVVLLFCVTIFAQEQKVDYKKIDHDLVKATYYFVDNASVIEKEGFFNKEGKLHGIWTNYDINGNKKTVATYKNGMKDGVWTYFKEDKISVVIYIDNKIISVDEKALIVN